MNDKRLLSTTEVRHTYSIWHKAQLPEQDDSNGTGRTYREHHLGSDEVPDITINTSDMMTIETYASDAVPIFIGHNWLTGTPKPLATNVACTDYCVAKGGKLVAYRWDGESTLCDENFHWIKD